MPKVSSSKNPAVIGGAGVKKAKHGFRVGPQNLPDGPWKRKLEKAKKNLIHKAKVKKQYAKIKAQVAKDRPRRASATVAGPDVAMNPKETLIPSNSRSNDGNEEGEESDEALTSGSDDDSGDDGVSEDEDTDAEDGEDSGSDSGEEPRAEDSDGSKDGSEEESDDEGEDGSHEKPLKRAPKTPKPTSTDTDASDTMHPSRKHTKAHPARPGYFDKQIAQANAKKRAAEERASAIDTKRKEREAAILARQKRRKEFGRSIGIGAGSSGPARGRGRGRGYGFSSRGGRPGHSEDGKRKLGRESELLLERVQRLVGGNNNSNRSNSGGRSRGRGRF
ncbi:hypothetical protein CFO_g1024 [Ceratocystis platani]|uniref:rRNA-processing protein FYV7 n=1 Tax=Ceratocystis fimbriata f. sp. platani TaxID=88771 RepID=A0A0F8B4A3_CERFI|nr:hypothetical protein CFO_g1024 [Ceratocystis platani]